MDTWGVGSFENDDAVVHEDESKPSCFEYS